MDLALLVYAVSLLEGFKFFFALTIVLSVVVLIISGIFTATWRFDGSEYSWNLNKDGTVKERILEGRRFGEKVFKYAFISMILAGLANTFLPLLFFLLIFLHTCNLYQPS